jgi:hypothetical protein
MSVQLLIGVLIAAIYIGIVLMNEVSFARLLLSVSEFSDAILL